MLLHTIAKDKLINLKLKYMLTKKRRVERLELFLSMENVPSIVIEEERKMCNQSFKSYLLDCVIGVKRY